MQDKLQGIAMEENHETAYSVLYIAHRACS